MPLNKIKLIIFDLDGVLTETSTYHFSAWKQLTESIGVTLDDSFESNLKGISRKASLERILDAHHLNHQFTDLQKNNMMDVKNNLYKTMISHMTEKDLFNGVIALFKFLKKHQIKIALGSASKNAMLILDKLQIHSYFDYIVDPSQLKSKPQPDIFLDAMHHFKYQPDECIGIEDAIAGIKAINSAGMTSIGIGSKDELKNADYCFPSIKEIPLDFMRILLKGESK